jgi:hypothetical protein
VISEDLIAAIIVHHKTTIPKIFKIKVHITHKPEPQAPPITLPNHVISSHHTHQADHSIFNLKSHTDKVFQFPVKEIVPFHPEGVETNQFHTTYINKNQKLSANIVYTGTIAKAINSFTLNLEKNHSQTPSFLSKKNINQKRGDNIIYIHI